MSPHVEEFGPQRVAYLRHVGPYHEVGATWTELIAFATERGLLAPDTLRIGVCHDDPAVTPAAELRYDACLSVADDFVAAESVQVQQLAGGPFASTTLVGSYAGLGTVYGELAAWASGQGKTLRRAPCLEIYRNSCPEVTEDELITDVFVPVAE